MIKTEPEDMLNTIAHSSVERAGTLHDAVSTLLISEDQKQIFQELNGDPSSAFFDALIDLLRHTFVPKDGVRAIHTTRSDTVQKLWNTPKTP